MVTYGIRRSNRNRLLPGIFFLLVFTLIFGAWAFADDSAETTAPPLLSGCEIDYPPFCFSDKNGRANGFSVELMEAALQAMGRRAAFRIGHWDDVRGWLERGEVQALPLVGRTPERERLFDFTFPYMSLHGAIVVRTGVSDIDGLGDLRGKRVAVMKGDNTEEFLRREDRGIEIHTTATFKDALRELSEGRYDAVFIQRLVALRIIQESKLTNLVVIDRPVEGFRQDFCFAVPEGDRDTLALLNEGLALVMADRTYQYLHAKWFAAWELPTHRRIIIGGDHNYPPFEFLDEKGRPAGFNVDLSRAIARALDLDIEIYLGPWSEIRRKLARGEIDVIQGMLYSPERDLTFDFTSPYTVTHYVGVVREGTGPPPASAADLRGLRIVVQKGDIMHDFAIENGLEDQVTAVDAQEDALRELAVGRHDCALVARLTALYWINKNGWDDLIVGQRAFFSPGYCFAVPQNHKALLAQFGEGLKILDETGEYRRIYEKWMGVFDDSPPSFPAIFRYVAMVAIPLFLLLFIVSLWLWSLRKQVTLRTAELRKSEEKYRLLAENTMDVIWIINLDLEFTYVNHAILDMTGYTSEEWIGTSLPEHCDENNFTKMTRVIAQELAEGPAGAGVFFEAVMYKKNRDLLPVEIHGKVIYDRYDQPICLQGVTRDISERKRAEEALRESEARYRAIVDNLPVTVCRWLPDTTLTYANRHYIEKVSESADIAGKRWLDFVPEALRAELAASSQNLAANPRSVSSEQKVLTRNGSTAWYLWMDVPIFDHDEILVEFQSVGMDITDLKRAEAERERLQSAIEQAGEAIIITDSKGVIQYINPAFERITGYNREEVLGQNPGILKSGEQNDSFYRELWDTISSGRTWAGRMVNRRKDGSFFTENVTISPVFNGSTGEIVNYVAVERDITDEIRLEAQFQQIQKMDSIGRLAGGVAHDYNNMLTVIIGNAQLAMDKAGSDNSFFKDFEKILSAAKRSRDITRQLLAFARKQTIAPQTLDLNVTVEGMLRMIQRLIGEDIDLLWKPGAGAFLVEMDPTQIDQILVNLSVNARDAISGVGKVTIETDLTALDDDYCADHPGFIPGDFVLMAVSDNGCGMDKKTLNHIFEPFFTTKTAGQGTGLGLATVYGIVKQNDGFINVYSEPGKGTTIKIYLPYRIGDQVDKTELEDDRPPTGRGETVLVVEDEPQILDITEKILRKLGYHVLVAGTPKNALDLARERGRDIRLLLTDVIMPEMNGRDLSDRLQSVHPGIKTLYMSGYTANVIAHHGVLDEGVHFIQKPYAMKDLAAKVRDAIDY